jgi:hypothetical protein
MAILLFIVDNIRRKMVKDKLEITCYEAAVGGETLRSGGQTVQETWAE